MITEHTYDYARLCKEFAANQMEPDDFENELFILGLSTIEIERAMTGCWPCERGIPPALRRPYTRTDAGTGREVPLSDEDWNPKQS